MGQGHFLAAVPLFERAIALDPNFAMAYFFLGAAFDTAGDAGRNRGILRNRLSRLIDRVSEFERVTHHGRLLHGHWRVGQSKLTPINWASANYPRDLGIP